MKFVVVVIDLLKNIALKLQVRNINDARDE